MAMLHQEVTLDLNADSAEWCPNVHFTDILAVGTYQLDESRNTRNGRLYAFAAHKPGGSDAKWQLHRRAQLDCSGIFDMRWAPHTPSPVLALALASGSVQMLELNDAHGGWQEVVTTDIAQGMVLTVDWARHAAHAGRAVASTSTGHLAVLQAAASGLEVSHLWQGHDLEAWSIAVDCWQADLVFSGSDDSSLKGWDLRQSPNMPAFVNRREHGAGVCCMQSSPAIEHLLVTGSYDERVRLWDLRMLRRPTCTSQVTTGGGVWRLKWHPHDPKLLLAACMHNGFAVLHLSDASVTSEVTLAEEYAHQKTLGYGADWCHMKAADGQALAATCSFYDRLLHLWQPSTRYTQS